jgi:hypothetical protein
VKRTTTAKKDSHGSRTSTLLLICCENSKIIFLYMYDYLVQVLQYLDFCSFVANFEIRNYELSLFFSKIVFAVLYPMNNHTNHMTMLPSCIK